MRQERGMERNADYYRERGIAVMIGQLHRSVAAMLGLDQIIRTLFLGGSLVRSCVSNVAANAPKTFSNTAELCMHWQQRDLGWTEQHVTVCRNVLYHCILLF